MTNNPEPLFFFGDVLQGFMNQSILMNTLISDNGVTSDKIEFHIKLPGMDSFAHFTGLKEDGTELRHNEFEHTNGPEIKDVLVGIPGGMIGRHAFYAFLENVMRNAAKYGRKLENNDDDRFVICFDLKAGIAFREGKDDKPVDCWWLEISDNRGVTDCERLSTCVKVKTYNNDPIIQEDGSPQVQGHGIQEMKICAAYLGGEELIFPADGHNSCEVGVAHVSSDSFKSFLTEHSRCLEVFDGNRRAWADEMQPMQVFLDGEDGKKQLKYRLIVQKPVIFGMVNFKSSCPAAKTSTNELDRQKNPAVQLYSDIKTLAEGPAHFGLILVENAPHIESAEVGSNSSNFYTQEETKQLIADIAKYHHALPYRLMIVAPKFDMAVAWQKCIDAYSAGLKLSDDANSIGKVQPYVSIGTGGGPTQGCLPVRRVFAVTCPSLFEQQGQAKTEIPDFKCEFNDEGNDYVCTEAKALTEPCGYAAFKEVYETWLWAWKGDALKQELSGKGDISTEGLNKWHIWIGFHRKGATAEVFKAKWCALSYFQSKIVEVHTRVRISEDESVSLNCESKNESIAYNGHNHIVFDNHGSAFGKGVSGISEQQWYSSSYAFWQKFSGADQMTLFHMLETPPTDPFGFAFFVFSLVESSLMNLAVVDERVGDAMLGKTRILKSFLLPLQQAGIYPLFHVHFKTGTGDAEYVHKALSPNIERCTYNTVAEREGLFFQREDAIVRVFHKEGDDKTLESIHESKRYPDALVMHEGMIDAISNHWSKELQESLYSKIPYFVRTSGRGSASRHEGEHLPFIEFTELSSTTYQGLNKHALGRSILGLRGSLL